MPDPVFAAPSTSLPCKAKPMVCLCISVTTRYWASCNPSICRVGREERMWEGKRNKKKERKKTLFHFVWPRTALLCLENAVHGNTYLKLSLKKTNVQMQINNAFPFAYIISQRKFLYLPLRVFFDNGKSENLWISLAFIWNKIILINAYNLTIREEMNTILQVGVNINM